MTIASSLPHFPKEKIPLWVQQAVEVRGRDLSPSAMIVALVQNERANWWGDNLSTTYSSYLVHALEQDFTFPPFSHFIRHINIKFEASALSTIKEEIIPQYKRIIFAFTLLLESAKIDLPQDQPAQPHPTQSIERSGVKRSRLERGQRELSALERVPTAILKVIFLFSPEAPFLLLPCSRLLSQSSRPLAAHRLTLRQRNDPYFLTFRECLAKQLAYERQFCQALATYAQPLRSTPGSPFKKPLKKPN